MKNFKSKVAKVALAGALAVTGLAGTSLMDSPSNPLSATKAEAATTQQQIWAYSYSPNQLTHNFWLQDNAVNWSGETIGYYIWDTYNNDGIAYLRNGTATFQNMGSGIYQTNTLTSNFSSLPRNKRYTLEYYSSSFSGPEKLHKKVDFYINSNGSITVY